jgi:hypothetical protein
MCRTSKVLASVLVLACVFGGFGGRCAEAGYSVTAQGDLIVDGGSLGIDTSDPQDKLHVSTSPTPYPGDGAHIANAYVGVWDTSSEYAAFVHSNFKTAQGSYALLQHHLGTTLLNAASGKDIYLMINNQAKVRVASNGYVGIGTGTSSPSALLDVAGSVVVDGELKIGQKITFDPYPYTYMTITFKPGDGESVPPANLVYEDVSGDFSFTFDVRAPSFIETSSRDLKTSITEISTAQAWSDLDVLTPVSYVFKQDVAPDGSVPPDQHYRGFIAEDLPKSLKLTTPVVRLSHIISCNTAALKEAKAVILDQEAHISAQEGRIRALEADVAALKAALGQVVMSAPVADGQ